MRTPKVGDRVIARRKHTNPGRPASIIGPVVATTATTCRIITNPGTDYSGDFRLRIADWKFTYIEEIGLTNTKRTTMVTFAFMLPTRDGEIIGATNNPMLLDYSLVRDCDVWHIIARVEPTINAGGSCYTLIRVGLPRGVGGVWAAIQARRELAGRLADGRLTATALATYGDAPADLYDTGENLRIRNGLHTWKAYAV